ncbi:NADPH:quinone oxidoreductase family protein [Lutimaribacter sp. EGI FJ00015]|uniref:NADPH:quinone oxidoreductase family protein n=1 Tax=Lutimaribacter degradans TaxID=2945989 RepID=A0ACC5ZXC3_9RHOB|nr:NADPH:quinone oxidoreductase family protein [Lutimaribacter sp. EGI FJ00013]MCM2562707.1 NADPH:quinone oxidoreductase family protein [Lutimaribacter sp. EGI FJ00013]MCO0613864.1 NADPH:quinone oxidoreductase family protein [Lutimaribacter sp. EGI FJ00015]MCO0636653.1 NADPH:quinone oxidoreductase family protein [Lutimaribacter sp. EGI FJ00014]
MRAFTVPGTGAMASVTDRPVPRPGPGELRLKIEACGLNFADLLMEQGKYQDMPEPPFTLGMEVAGVVDALGPDVEGPSPGTRVAVFGGQGGLAEFGCFPAKRTVPLPDGMSATHAAAFQVAYGTSHVALHHRAQMQPGETLLVLGAAGGVGLTAVEVGKLMGATVIACARGADKLEIAAKAGADHVIDATSDDIRARVKALGGADVVYDPVGGEQWQAAFRVCKPEARLLPIGFASGEVPQIPANHLMVKNLSVLGVYWGGYLKFRPEVVTDSIRTLLGWYAEGRLKPHVSHVLPLERARDGLELLRARKSTGKVVITP